MASSTDNPKLEQLTHVENITPSDQFEYTDDAAERGAALQEAERDMTVRQLLALHWRAVLFCGVAFTASAMYGYDSIANNATLSMPAFLLYFGEVGPTGPYLPSKWTALYSSMSNLSQSLGALIAGFLMDMIGRKYAGTALSIFTLAGTAGQYVSQTNGGLLAGKMVVGMGIGGALAVGLTYASEIAPLKLRSSMQQSIVLAQVVFYMIGVAIVRVHTPIMDESSFRNVFAIQWALGGASTLYFLAVPESPNYLIQKERLTAAHKAVSQIYHRIGNVDDRLSLLIKTVRDEKAASAETGSYMDCFRGVDRTRTFATMFLLTAHIWGGSLFLTQNTLLLITAGLEALHVYDIGIAGFALSIVILLASWLLDGRFRRHTAFFWGTVFNFLFLVCIGALWYVPGTSGLWAAAVLMNVLISFQTAIVMGMGWPIAAEISSYRLRGKTLAAAVQVQTLSSWLTAFVVPYMFNVDAGNLGVRTGWVFAATSAGVVAGAWFLVPDTTDLLASEIDERYMAGVKPRQFQKAM